MPDVIEVVVDQAIAVEVKNETIGVVEIVTPGPKGDAGSVGTLGDIDLGTFN